MKTKLFFLISLLAAVIVSFGGCGDDKEDLFITDTFEGTENEVVVFELENVPAYVTTDYGGYVSIYYSEYVDDYFVNKNFKSGIEGDIMDHRIGVKLSDYNAYGIPLYSKIYISASVTNRGRALDENGEDFGYINGGVLPVQRKAYLIDLRSRN